MSTPNLIWLTADLRLRDNPALVRAIARRQPVIPVFVWAPDEEIPWAPGAASRWWLHQSLKALEGELEDHGSKLIIRRGKTLPALLELAGQTGAKAVFWNRRYEPAVIARDRAVKQGLAKAGLETEICGGNVLFEPGTVVNAAGKPFQVFSAFWKACQALPAPPDPEPAPRKIPGPGAWPESLAISDLGLEPAIDWASGIRDAWRPGEEGAERNLKRFLDQAIQTYPTGRDRPDQSGTSRLSPHLHFGEISARQIWHAAGRESGAAPFLREIAWREFSYHLMVEHPHTPEDPLRPEFREFPWKANSGWFHAWTRGKTGYPLVDAGMRQLWHTGWMHNRVRMLVASFLVKHLLTPWQEGAAWFWDTLVDADLANNTMGWQWTAGCGADAAPYFRIFNPVLQGAKFDPQGVYVRRWVPELAQVSDEWIHKPWEDPRGLPKDYPAPIVEHAAARERALAALAAMRERRAGNGH